MAIFKINGEGKALLLHLEFWQGSCPGWVKLQAEKYYNGLSKWRIPKKRRGGEGRTNKKKVKLKERLTLAFQFLET